MRIEEPRHQPPVKLTRRSFLKKAALAAGGVMLIPPGGLAYARYAEPRWLDTEKLSLSFTRWPEALNGLRVVQFSDLHFGYHFGVEALRRLVDRINGLEPDLVCFTGDLVDYGVGPEGPAASHLLRGLKSRLGVYAVLGNHDYYGGLTEDVVKVLAEGGVTLLRNQSARLELNGAAFRVAGVEDQWEGKPDLDKALNGVKPEEFVLLLSHCPDYADLAVQHNVDLQLSGHSHGGQVRLPFVGSVVTPAYSKKYIQGHYSLEAGKLQVYVNRGIGVSVYPIRFLCRPELTLFTMRRG